MNFAGASAVRDLPIIAVSTSDASGSTTGRPHAAPPRPTSAATDESASARWCAAFASTASEPHRRPARSVARASHSFDAIESAAARIAAPRAALLVAASRRRARTATLASRKSAPAPESNCVITLTSQRQDDGTVIYLREANRSLALVCILSESVLAQQGLLEYNFGVFRSALFELFHQ